MKKIISYIAFLFVLFSVFGTNVNATSFIQKSTRQNSTAVANNDPVTAGKWNAVVLDLSNIIADLGGLKTYIDSNITNNFVVQPTRMENLNRDIAISKKLFIGKTLDTNQLDISVGGLTDNTIFSNNIKDGTIKLEDFDPSVSFGNTEYWTQNGLNIYYNGGNVAIGQNTASEKLVIKNGNIKIRTNGNGLLFPNGQMQTTALLAPTNTLHLTGNQTVNDNKTFDTTISLQNNNKIDTIKDSTTAFVTPDDNSIASLHAVKNLVTANTVTGLPGKCGGDNGRILPLNSTPKFLCEFGTPSAVNFVDNGVSTPIGTTTGNNTTGNSTIYTSCREIAEKVPNAQSGNYTINPGDGNMDVYCDMTNNGGGWTRYVNIKSNYTNTDAVNCWKGNTINNSALECFNPNRHNINATQLMAKINGNTYIHNIPSSYQTASFTTTSTRSNYHCLGNGDYMTIMGGSGVNTSADGSNAIYTWFGGNYCVYDRSLGGKSLGNGDYMNYSKSGNFGPIPGGRESSSKAQELYFRDKAPVIPTPPSSGKSCREIAEKVPNAQSGIYTINPGTGDISVYCDMTTDGGGWTRFLKYQESVGGKNPGTTVHDANYKLAITPDTSDVKILLNGCGENDKTLILNLDTYTPKQMYKWIQNPVSTSLNSGVDSTNTIYTTTDINGNTIYYGHNNSDATNEFETLTFTNHVNTNYQDTRKYAKWGVIDGGNTNVRTSYNNKTGYAPGTENNEDDLICAAYRDKKPVIPTPKKPIISWFEWTCTSPDNIKQSCGAYNKDTYLGKDVTIVNDGTASKYSDGTMAYSCNDYIHPIDSVNYPYKGDTGDGWYYIKPQGVTTAQKVYCDMTTDGGGWTSITYYETNTDKYYVYDLGSLSTTFTDMFFAYDRPGLGNPNDLYAFKFTNFRTYSCGASHGSNSDLIAAERDYIKESTTGSWGTCNRGASDNNNNISVAKLINSKYVNDTCLSGSLHKANSYSSLWQNKTTVDGKTAGLIQHRISDQTILFGNLGSASGRCAGTYTDGYKADKVYMMIR